MIGRSFLLVESPGWLRLSGGFVVPEMREYRRISASCSFIDRLD